MCAIDISSELGVLDAIPDGAFVVSPDLEVLFWNKAIENWSGIASSDIVGSKLSIAFPSLNTHSFCDRLRRVAEGGPPDLLSSRANQYIIPATLKNGKPMLQRVVASFVPGKAEGALRALVLINDVSDTPIAIENTEEDRLQHEQQKLELERIRAALDDATDAVLVLDDQKLPCYLNRAFGYMFGFTDASIAELDLEKLIVDRKAASDILSTFDVGLSWTGEIKLSGRDGGEIECLMRSSAIYDDHMEIIGFLLMFTDMSDRKRYETRMQQAARMQSIGKLCSGIAHEYNNQHAAILGFAELIAAGKNLTAEKTKRYITNIIECSRVCSDLTYQLLAFSQQGKYQVVRTDITHVIGDVIDLLKHGINEEIQIRNQIKIEKAMVMGDLEQLRTVLLNVSINGRDSMPDGGELTFDARIVDLTAEDSEAFLDPIAPGSYVCLTIADTGVGMPPEVFEHLFEPFFSTKALSAGRGVGLGMASAYGIVRNHDGAITIDSKIGEGTTVYIYLPHIDSSDPEAAGENVNTTHS